MDTMEKARELQRRHPVVDTHSHFLLNGHYLGKDFGKRHRPPWLWNPLRNTTDLPRLQDGGIACAAATVYVPIPPLRLSAYSACLRMLDTLDHLVEKHAPEVVKVESAQTIRAAHAAGRLALLPAVEGGHVLGKRLERLETLRRRGVRLLTLTHFIANRICDAAWGPAVHGGLSSFGREVIAACQRLGIVVDLTHASEAAFFAALERLELPPLVTHTGLRLPGMGKRQLSQDQVQALAQKGGAIGVIFWPWYLKPRSVFGRLELVADAYARLAEMVGTEHLVVGSDMDGWTWMPRGFRDAADFPRLVALLLERGFSEEDLARILGGNALRILSRWER